MSIPGWTATRLLPPIWPGTDGATRNRSPYSTTISEVIQRFATTPKRIEILDGLLRYRSAMHDLEMKCGFQWLNGSFMEEVEVTEDRAPNDIDVVTFFELPMGLSSQTELFDKAPSLFASDDGEKQQFKVDAYYVQLGQALDRNRVSLISYWYSMWSHRRDMVWKGFLQIDLDLMFDAEAKAFLDAAASNGGVA